MGEDFPFHSGAKRSFHRLIRRGASVKTAPPVEMSGAPTLGGCGDGERVRSRWVHSLPEDVFMCGYLTRHGEMSMLVFNWNGGLFPISHRCFVLIVCLCFLIYLSLQLKFISKISYVHT